VYPGDDASVEEKLEWHERRHEVAHEALDKLGVGESFSLLLEDRIRRLPGVIGQKANELIRTQRDEARSEVERLTMEFAAANSELEKLTKELEEAQKQIKDLQGLAVDLFSARDNAIAERDAARLLNQELKTELDHALVELHQARANTRSEPSRLEIAAMLLAGWFCNFDNPDALACPRPKWWIEQADALIAAAKEGK
jgi:chromosome segregation ATPase